MVQTFEKSHCLVFYPFAKGKLSSTIQPITSTQKLRKSVSKYLSFQTKQFYEQKMDRIWEFTQHSQTFRHGLLSLYHSLWSAHVTI